jgi:uncharacterized damage-inducible protein DinB
MKQYFIKLVESEIWANNLLAEALEKAVNVDDRSLLLFSHLLSSYSMWMSRIKATEFTTTIFQERTLAESKQLMQTMFKDLQQYLETIDNIELERIVHFTFPIDGSKRTMSVADALMHIVTHSCYHRGQIVAQLKGKIELLPLTTYIAFASKLEA